MLQRPPASAGGGILSLELSRVCDIVGLAPEPYRCSTGARHQPREQKGDGHATFDGRNPLAPPYSALLRAQQSPGGQTAA